MNQTLYTNAAQTQYYLLPAEADLPAGDFIICAATGEERAVEEEAIAAFAIDEAAAEAYIKEQLNAGVEQTKLALTQAWARAKQKAKARREAREVRQAARSLKSLLDSTADDFQKGSDLAAESARHFSTGLQLLLKSISSDDPAAHEAARSQMRGLQDRLEEAGLDPGVDMEALPAKLRAAYLADQDREQRMRDAAADQEEESSRE